MGLKSKSWTQDMAKGHEKAQPLHAHFEEQKPSSAFNNSCYHIYPRLEEWNQKTWSANRSKMVLASQQVKQNCNQSSLKRNEGISHAKVVRRKKNKQTTKQYINLKWWFIRFRSDIFSLFPLLVCLSIDIKKPSWVLLLAHKHQSKRTSVPGWTEQNHVCQIERNGTALIYLN